MLLLEIVFIVLYFQRDEGRGGITLLSQGGKSLTRAQSYKVLLH